MLRRSRGFFPLLASSFRSSSGMKSPSFECGWSERRYFGADPSDRRTLRTVLRETPVDLAIERMDFP